MSETLFFILLFIALELFEVSWQKASTLGEVLQKIYRYYEKNIFLVFLLHPTMYLAIYMMMLSNYDIYLQVLFGIKLSDIALKLVFVHKVFIKQEIEGEMKMMLGMKVEWYMLYFGVVFYPVLIWLGMN